jgi:GT2 family glycosyltransferase
MSRRVSVVVSTMNRPDQVVECVRCILASSDRDLELIVVDQSELSACDRARTAVGDDPRLSWVATKTRGLSVSRNIGVSRAGAPIVAFTDDDCRVPLDWLARIHAAFSDNKDLGLLFGAVVLSPEDRAKGYAAEFEPIETRTFHHEFPSMRSQWGVGANMVVRRAVFAQIGDFDEMLGAGARFHAGEEIDLTIRALSNGFKVLHASSISVVHLGVREGPAASRLIRHYGIGLGATLAKHIRLGTRGALVLLTQWLTVHGGRSIRRFVRGDRHPGFGLLAAVLWGAFRSCGTRIDSGRCSYRE